MTQSRKSLRSECLGWSVVGLPREGRRMGTDEEAEQASNEEPGLGSSLKSMCCVGSKFEKLGVHQITENF